MTGVATRERFAIRSWRDGGAVFDRLTGSTHCFNAATLSVFLTLRASSTDDDELAAGLQALMPASTAEQRREAAIEAKQVLLAAGLFDDT